MQTKHKNLTGYFQISEKTLKPKDIWFSTHKTGDANFYVVPVTKGDIHETKLQTKSEKYFRAVSK